MCPTAEEGLYKNNCGHGDESVPAACELRASFMSLLITPRSLPLASAVCANTTPLSSCISDNGDWFEPYSTHRKMLLLFKHLC